MKAEIFKQCQKLFPEWANSSFADFDFDDPKGFSSFIMGIRSSRTIPIFELPSRSSATMNWAC